MFCEKCGAKLNDGDMFCEVCGERAPSAFPEETVPLSKSEFQSYANPAPPSFDSTYQAANAPFFQQINNPLPPREKKKLSAGKKALIILIIVAVVIVALGITAAVIFFTGSAYSVYNSMNDGDYSLAVSKYNNEVADDFPQDNILKLLLNGRVDDAAAKYQSGEIEYIDAVNELNALSDMKFEGSEEKIDEILDAEAKTITDKYNNKEIDYSAADAQLTELANMGYEQADSKRQELMSIEESRNAFSAGNDYYDNGDYEEAITEYNKISESDENYSEAQTKLNELYPKYIDYIVEQADSYISFGEYESALSYINTAESILPENIDKSKLDEAKNNILDDYKSDILNQVTDLMNDSNYITALKVIADALRFDENTDFQNMKTTVENNYYKSITEEVQSYIDIQDYASAKRLVESVMNNYSSSEYKEFNKKLKELSEKVENETPTYLLDVCKPYETSDHHYIEYANGEKFSMGGMEYTNGFALSTDFDGYAIFNLNSKYSSIGFDLGIVDGSGMQTSTIKIYYDNVLKAEYTVEGDSLPKRITLNVTGVKQFKVLVENVHGSTYGLGNITVE